MSRYPVYDNPREMKTKELIKESNRVEGEFWAWQAGTGTSPRYNIEDYSEELAE